MKNRVYCFFTLFLVITITSCAYQVDTPSNLEMLSAIEDAFVEIAQNSKPAIVGVLAENTDRRQNRFGSGFFFREDGHILTNDHIVNNGERFSVRLLDGRVLDAKMVGSDIITDVAVLKVDRDEKFPFLPLADSKKVRVGQFTIAIGNPFQLNYSVTTGVVSGTGRSILGGLRMIRYQDFIQTDAWINTGSSGGPLLNIYGEVIGINALIRKEENTPAPVRAGAGFAIPSNLVEKIGNELIAKGKIIRGYLGISMREIEQGILVDRVGPGTPADKAGLRRRDVITEYNGVKVKDSTEFQLLIAETQVGKKSIIKVLRRGQERTLNVTIAEIPPEMVGLPFEEDSVSWKMLGLAVRKLEKRDADRYTYLTEADQGVIVERVKQDAPAYNAKIPRGALILAINGEKITDVNRLESVLQSKQNAEELMVEIKSSHGTEKLKVLLQK